MNILYVALGGALGAVLRYLLGLIPIPFKTEFPFVTLGINFVGAIVIGIVAFWSIRHSAMNESLSLFLKVGVCGGFTTFSTFSLEAYNLFEKGSVVLGITYICVSLVLCLLGVYLGKSIACAF